MIITLFSAIFASILHVISGPDHLAAVTPLAISSQQKGWKIGLFWGFGHLIGMLLIGLLFLTFKDLIPVEKISSYSEQLVALVLIVVGLWTFYRIFNKNDVYLPKKEIKQNVFSSFSIGFIHGLAGVAHFILLLPVLAFDTKIESILYIIGFAIGTITAMTIYALIIGNIARFSKNVNNPLFFKGIRFTGGLFAIIIGVYWLFLTF